MTSFSDLFKLGKEVLKTETFVLHEAQTRGQGSQGGKCLVKCLFIFGLNKAERAQVSGDIRTFRKAKHPCIVALQDVIAEPETSSSLDVPAGVTQEEGHTGFLIHLLSADRFCYMIYEHMAGGSLTEHLGTGRQFKEEEVKAMVARILEALAALHSLGLYHGHVTPSRILFSSPSHDERGAATAKLCYLENIKGLAGAWPTDQIISTTPGVNVQEEKDCRDADILSLGLTAFAAFMGDAGAAAGEPLESFRATNESTGMPELSPQGRDAIDIMLASDPSLSIPSAAELLRHPWFPVQPMDSKGATAPMPLGPGQTVPFGPPARPERIPTGLSPMVPRMTEMGAKKAKMGGSARADSEAGSEAGAAAKVSSMVETTDGSQALCAWLKKNTERSHLSFKPHWQRRWFVLNPSTAVLLIYNHEVDLKAKDADTAKRPSGNFPKAFPLDSAYVLHLVRPGVRDKSSNNILVIQDSANRFPSLQLAFDDEQTMELWFQTLKSVKDVRSAGPRPRVKSQSLPVPAGVSGGGASDGTDWWDDVSHQAQRVAHVTAASMSIGATGEAEMCRFVEEKLHMHKQTARSLHLNGSIRSGGTSLFGGGGSMVIPSSNNAGTLFKNSALHWERRVEELAAVTSGKPINSAILPGERWFIVDARWMDHWLDFCTSKRRMAPPGPIDNSWMLHKEKRHVPYEGLTLAIGKEVGDYRRVGQECWDQLMRLYGGGPAIYVDGPPVEDLSRWVVRFGHQVATKSSVRRAHRHIPNPSVSVSNLQQAAMRWVGGWDEDDEDEGGDDMELDDHPEALATHDNHASGSGNIILPLAALSEEETAAESTDWIQRGV